MGMEKGERSRVMKFNMASMSEQEVERAVAERCSSYGTVKRLRIYLPRRDSIARPFALVDMATQDEAESLAGALGRLAMDSAVVIFLQHEHDRVAALMRNQCRAIESTVFPPLIVE
jgi:hypothetical protein